MAAAAQDDKAFASWLLPFVASFLSSAVVRVAASYSDQTLLLLLLTVLVYLLVLGATELLKRWYQASDGVIDAYESVTLQVAQFVAWVLVLMIPNFLFGLVTVLFEAWLLPRWYEALALAWLYLVVLVVAFSMFLGRTLNMSLLSDASATTAKK